MLEIVPFTDDPDTGARDRTVGSVLLYRTGDQAPFGYDYVQWQGWDDTCDAPGKSPDEFFYDILREHEFGRRFRGIPVVREPDGRITMKGVIEQDVGNDGALDSFPMMVLMGAGRRTVTVDLVGVPPPA